MNKTFILKAILGVVLVLLICIGYNGSVQCVFKGDGSSRGQFGDGFGALTCFFSGVGFILLWLSLNNEIEASRKERAHTTDLALLELLPRLIDEHIETISNHEGFPYKKLSLEQLGQELLRVQVSVEEWREKRESNDVVGNVNGRNLYAKDMMGNDEERLIKIMTLIDLRMELIRAQNRILANALALRA